MTEQIKVRVLPPEASLRPALGTPYVPEALASVEIDTTGKGAYILRFPTPERYSREGKARSGWHVHHDDVPKLPLFESENVRREREAKETAARLTREAEAALDERLAHIFPATGRWGIQALRTGWALGGYPDVTPAPLERALDRLCALNIMRRPTPGRRVWERVPTETT